jgi:hypothetical protein
MARKEFLSTSDDKERRLPTEGPTGDRRSGTRAASVFRPVLIELEDFSGFSLIRNISPQGMMGQVYAQFVPGQAITVHFNPERAVTGRIAWSKDLQIGVQFDTEIDVEHILSEFGKKYNGNKVNRAPRLPIDCTGEFATAGQTLTANLQDISQRGVKVHTSNFCPGDEVSIRLPEMKPKKAIVRWVQQDTSGLNFLEPLGYEELARWVIERQSRSSNQAGEA